MKPQPASPADPDSSQPRNLVSPALVGLLILAICYTLMAARDYFLPIFLALILYFLFSPLVRILHRRLRLPPAAGAVLVLALLLGTTGYGIYRLAEPAGEWMEKAPQSLRTVERKLRKLRAPVEQVNEAASEVEKLTDVEDSDRSVQKVEIQSPGLSETLLAGTQHLIGGIAIVVMLLFFLLASGEGFLRKVMRAIPALKRQSHAVAILRVSERQISTYLATVSLINAGLGVAVAIAMYLLGVPNPLLWGVLAAFLNFIPYLGALVGVIVLSLMSALTFDSIGAVLAPPATYYILNAFEGTFVTPTVLGERFAFSPVVIILWLLLWTWMWGVWGAFLAMPLLTIFRIFCDRLEPLEPMKEIIDR